MTDDEALMQDAERWIALQRQLERLVARRAKLEADRLLAFKALHGTDPRDISQLPNPTPGIRVYEAFYRAARAGEIEDEIGPIAEEQAEIEERIAHARPTTAAGALALARVCFAFMRDAAGGAAPGDFAAEVFQAHERALECLTPP